MRLLAALAGLPLLATSLLATSLLAAGGVAAASSSCATPGARWTAGSIQGQDGAYINAQIGVQALNGSGQTVSLDGCPTTGYTESVFVNTDVSGQGSTNPSGHTKSWSVSLPSNATSVWIEVYTRTNTPKPCPTCDGPIDTSRYGFVNRRAMPIDQQIPLTAPLHCGLSGGSSGQIAGHFTNSAGYLVAGSATAWSQVSENPLPTLQGWGESTEPAVGSYLIDTLASDQPYAVWGRIGTVTTRVDQVYVPACGQAQVSFGPGQLGSGLTLAPGGPSGMVAAWRGPNGQARVAELRAGTLTSITSLGGVVVGKPALAFLGGTEIVMVRSSNDYVYQDSNSGAGWSGWRQIGVRTIASPTLFRSPDGSLWMAAVATNRAVYLRHFVAGHWSGWVALGGQSVLAPALSVLANGVVELAATAVNHAVYLGAFTGHWSGWKPLGGVAYTAPAMALDNGTPFVVVASGGHSLWSRTATTGWVRTGGISFGTVGLAMSAGGTEIAAWGAGNFPFVADISGITAGSYGFAG